MKYLIIVDVQNDFTQRSGTLFVNGSDRAIDKINRLIESEEYDKIIATQDWHPENHISFAETHGKKPFVDTIQCDYGIQTLWPIHCVKGSWGAELDERLDIKLIDIIWRKGTNINLDSYSAFIENDQSTPTGLSKYLYNNCRETEVDICGVATDVCVYFTAIDCLNLISKKVRLYLPGCAGVDPENTEKAIDDMKRRGVVIFERYSIAEIQGWEENV